MFDFVIVVICGVCVICVIVGIFVICGIFVIFDMFVICDMLAICDICVIVVIVDRFPTFVICVIRGMLDMSLYLLYLS